jgi:colanic acid/amylovoran biosynthesis protein
MKIFIINAHWDNRGDEAAIRAMIDELLIKLPDVEIVIHFWINSKVYQFPYVGTNVRYISETPKLYRDMNQIPSLIMSLLHSKQSTFYKELKNSDLVIYAPGGASISDQLLCFEMNYLIKLILVKRLHKPYIFYAPSMGPFYNKNRNAVRRYFLNHSALLCVREPISAKYLRELGVSNKIQITLDSAFQHEIDYKGNQIKLSLNQELNDFIEKYDRVVGITITDLMWSSIYGDDKKLPKQIKNTFSLFVDELKRRGYGIVFIPQLFGEHNDYRYMKSFMKENCYILSDKYDCYFQQYLISQLYCVVGMRYHSNIFSAKMGTPFISISYQEKMKGFMQKVDLDRYCIGIKELSFQNLMEHFELLQNNYDSYKQYLYKMKEKFKKQAHQTTDLVCDYIKKNSKNTYETVEKPGNCIKCGMCSSVCKQKALKIVYDKDTGFYRNIFNRNRCNNCGVCLKVCPVCNNFNIPATNLIGDYKKILIGHATNQTIRVNATSGGCVNALVRYLIYEDKADSVLMVMENHNKHTGTGYAIIDKSNINILTQNPRKFASRYVCYPILAALDRLNNNDRVALVGTPCQLLALSNYQNVMKGKQIFKIGIACSGGISYKATALMLHKNNRKNGTIYYRGNGWPGQNSIIGEDEVHNENHLESFFSTLYTSQIFRNPACLQCNDQFAEQSDISFFDYWNLRELQREKYGNSGIIVRSENALEYLEEMIQKKYIEIKEQLRERDIVEAQGWPILLKKQEKHKKLSVSIYYKITNLIFHTKLYYFIPKKGFELAAKIFMKLINR